MAVQSTLRPPSLLQRLLIIISTISSTDRKRTLITGSGATLFLLSLLYEARRRRNLKHEKEQGRRRGIVRRNSGIIAQDGSKIIYVPSAEKKESGGVRGGGGGAGDGGGKEVFSRVVIHPTKATTFLSHRRLFLSQVSRGGKGKQQQQQKGGGYHPPPIDTKPGLNLAFLHQFLALWSIMVPRVGSKETMLLLLHAVFLMSRTYLSLVVARLDGEIVRDLVAGNGRGFMWGLLKWVGVGAPAVYCNAMIKYLQSKISIAFRTRLTRYIHDLYLNDELAYYKLANLDGGLTAGGGPDQYITSDLTLFCDSAAALISSLGKPSLDLMVFNYQLARSLGLLAFTGISANYIATAWLLRKMAPNFARLADMVGRGEGTVRAGYTRLISNAEEIAFYGGSDMEKTVLERGFNDLKKLLEGIYSLKIRYNMLEDFVLKYSWSAFGYLVSSVPIFLPAWGGLGGLVELATFTDTDHHSHASQNRQQARTGSFITNKRLMLSLADAGGRMMYSFKDLAELAGHTSRVYSLISTLHRVHAGSYPPSAHPEIYSLEDVQGMLHKGFDGVRLENVPVVAPNMYPIGGELLVEGVNIIVHAGEHLLISGPNGVGKSAIARIVAGLWPVYRGLVSRPRKVGGAVSKFQQVPFSGGGEGIMFLPQRVYMSVGTLRDQVIYPHTEMDMKAGGRGEADLMRVLGMVRLGYLVEREGGWDTRKEWKDVLSGGEKQRMGFARVLYHKPKFVFIDEGTSAVSSDVEGLLYDTCKAQGITLITISSRLSLKKYHTYQLLLGTVPGNPYGWDFDRIGTEKERTSVTRELEQLKERLREMEGLEVRLEEVERELRGVRSLGVEEGVVGEEQEQEEEAARLVRDAESVIADERDERWCRSVVNLEGSDVGDEGRYEEVSRKGVEKAVITGAALTASPGEYEGGGGGAVAVAVAVSAAKKEKEKQKEKEV
ncbi:ABC transporter transmembrane region 2-domain-containing protein [Peziza echinospora]|nr:ABC transporter transmembrane region 2-domain-containing protein [Peziza echinospora]